METSHNEAQAEVKAARRAGSTVLVVDDHPATLYATSRMLRHAGFRTLECSTGEDALALAEQAAALVLDVNLPDTHGVAVCEQLKKEPATAAKPVVLMSAALVKSVYADVGLQTGADAYLLAPLNPEELVGILDRLLRL